MYWSLAAPAIAGALDQIRTALVELVAEVRTEMPADASEPTGETVDRAFNIAARQRQGLVGAPVTKDCVLGVLYARASAVWLQDTNTHGRARLGPRRLLGRLAVCQL
jgi:hypothetical protein